MIATRTNPTRDADLRSARNVNGVAYYVYRRQCHSGLTPLFSRFLEQYCTTPHFFTGPIATTQPSLDPAANLLQNQSVCFLLRTSNHTLCYERIAVLHNSQK